MIKVTDTRMHKVSIIPEKTFITHPTEDKRIEAYVHSKSIPVADAELVCGGVTSYFKLMDIEEVRGKLRPILISRTEKIMDGDWRIRMDVLSNDSEFIVKCDLPSSGVIKEVERDNIEREIYKRPFYKILALPEHFSPKHLQAIVDGKLKEGKVLVECEQYRPSIQNLLANDGAMHIKLNSSNHITLHKDNSITPYQQAIDSEGFVVAGTKILEALKLVIGKDVNEHALPTIVQLMKNNITLHKVEEEIHSWIEVEEFGRKAFYAGREWEENRFPRCDYNFKRPTYNGYLRELDIVPHKVEEKMVPVSLLHSAFEAGMRFIGEDKGSFNEWFEQNVK